MKVERLSPLHFFRIVETEFSRKTKKLRFHTVFEPYGTEADWYLQVSLVLPDEQADHGGGQQGNEDAGEQRASHLLGNRIVRFLVDGALERADNLAEGREVRERGEEYRHHRAEMGGSRGNISDLSHGHELVGHKFQTHELRQIPRVGRIKTE